MFEKIQFITDLMWGIPLIVTLLGVGFYFTFISKFFQFAYIKHIWANTFGKMYKQKVEDKQTKGILAPLQAVSIAIGGTIGVGNIGGVATAIAVGGPGALFWLIIAGLVGQIIKMVEVTLAVYYRSKDEKGNHFGGPTYYMKKGICVEYKMPILQKILSFLFLFGMISSIFITMQNYTVTEAIASTFNFNDSLGRYFSEKFNWNSNLNYTQSIYSLIYTTIVYLMIAGGLKKLGKIAEVIVPFMCVFYLAGGLFIILKFYYLIPATLYLIIHDAFNGTAAVGGFVGATFWMAMQKGLARAVFSNEAGWGTSPMIHSTAKTDHPIRQGLWGVAEVTVSTLFVCTVTALVIIITSKWQTGLSGATLTLTAFEYGIGTVGRIVLTIGIFLFGITTTSGWYTYYDIIFRYLLGKESKFKDNFLKTYKWLYPLPGLWLVLYSVFYQKPSQEIWVFADFSTALPVFANVLAILILSPKFMILLKDYISRYIKKDNQNLLNKVFYEE
ncbi:MAG TPA: amino acid carrier protein [Ignavibacteriales bacterium]|nr:amino acid carrier protein [Ignavibacteriales bacterium]HPP34388.1 amino acid carrier protein [Ignavibacteriales bacterium]HRR19716.1 amino acid carrier protein [Ignavibacteriales bacterium]